MKNLNQDGFEPGQSLSLSDLNRLRGQASEAELSPLPSREGIAEMKREELETLLKLHGAETKGKMDELRERLIAAMFVDV